MPALPSPLAQALATVGVRDEQVNSVLRFFTPWCGTLPQEQPGEAYQAVQFVDVEADERVTDILAQLESCSAPDDTVIELCADLAGILKEDADEGRQNRAVLAALEKVMKAYRDSPAVQVGVCKAFTAMPKRRREQARCDVTTEKVDAVFWAMEQFPADKQVQTHGCRALRGDANLSRVGRHVSAASAALQHCRGDSKVTSVALENMILAADAEVCDLSEHNCEEKAITAMRDHPDSWLVQHRGLDLLAIAPCASPSPGSRYEDQCDGGSLDVALEVLARRPDSGYVQASACNALALFTDFAPAKAAARIIELRGIDAVVDILLSQSSSRSFETCRQQVDAIKVIKNLTGHSEESKALLLGPLKGFEAIVAAMRSLQDENFQEDCLTCLLQLVANSGSTDNVLSLLDMGACKLAVDDLDRWPKGEGVPEFGVKFLEACYVQGDDPCRDRLKELYTDARDGRIREQLLAIPVLHGAPGPRSRSSVVPPRTWPRMSHYHLRHFCKESITRRKRARSLDVFET